MSKPNYPCGLKRRVRGDWNCVKCSNLNFAFRFYCNRCQAPKKGSLTNLFNSALFLTLDEEPPFSYNSKLEENTNLPLKERSPNVDPKIIAPHATYRDNKKVETILADVKRPDRGRQGDWVCLNCKNLNFAYRNECNKCSENKTAYIEF